LKTTLTENRMNSKFHLEAFKKFLVILNTVKTV
jgi:hypothetical protein